MRLSLFLWRAQRRLFGCHLGKLFYQGRIDKEGNIIPPKKFFRYFNQRLIERSYTPPWAMTKEECQWFWKSITNEEKFGGNKPAEYAVKSMGIIEFLHNFWTPEVAFENSILELGCNCGANLNGLYNLGYHNLYGIEINEDAVNEMRHTFPVISKIARIKVGSLEDLLPRTPSDSVDVVFTIACLMHIHPTSNFIFSEMVRIAKRYIVVIEEEAANCTYVFVRNYRRVFQLFNCSQLKSVMITRYAFPNVSRSYDGYTARLFAVPNV